MAEACDKSVCKVKSVLLFFLFLFRIFFFAAPTPTPQKSRTMSRSPNRLKSHPIIDLRPPDPSGLYQYVSYKPENGVNKPHRFRKRWMHRELESLQEINGNTSSSSSQGSNHSHVVRLPESPGSTRTCAVSLGSPTIVPSKSAKDPGLGINYRNGNGFSVVYYFSVGTFSFNFYFLVQIDRSVRMFIMNIMNGTTGWTMCSVTVITIIRRACLLHRYQLI